MAGTIPFSLSQQFDRYGEPLSGGKLFLIQAGTTSTPQNGYQDSDLTIALPNPIILDAAGRLPQFFLADGLIKIRLTDADSVQQLVADGIQVIGPSSGGGGGGGAVDPTTVFQTGDVIWLDQSGARAGWVRDNGRTVGSSSSGATERANADCETLFGFLWQKYSNSICPVSGGRGSTSADDWAANKTIQLPDKRLYIPGGLADMGNSAVSLPAQVPIVSGDSTTPGSKIGKADHNLAANQLPVITPAFTGTPGTVLVSSSSPNVVQAPTVQDVGINNGAFTYSLMIGGARGGLNSTGTFTPSGSVGSFGSNGAHNNTQLTVLGTFYRKL